MATSEVDNFENGDSGHCGQTDVGGLENGEIMLGRLLPLRYYEDVSIVYTVCPVRLFITHY